METYTIDSQTWVVSSIQGPNQSQQEDSIQKIRKEVQIGVAQLSSAMEDWIWTWLAAVEWKFSQESIAILIGLHFDNEQHFRFEDDSG